jgi:PAS domain S-box-containing protein
LTSLHKVLIVEDYEPVRRAICTLLQQRADVLIVGEAADGPEAISQAAALQPDVVTIDIGLPSVNGLEVAGRIHAMDPRVRLLIVTNESSADVVDEAFSRGALGFVYKPRVYRDLLSAIDAILGGQQFVSSDLKRPTRLDGPDPHGHDELFYSSHTQNASGPAQSEAEHDTRKSRVPDGQMGTGMSIDRHERLVAVIQSATDAIVVIDEQQRILLFNPGAERLFGCSEQQAVGTLFERFVPPRLRASYAADFERLRAAHLPVSSRSMSPTSWGLRANGEEFPWEASIAEHELGGRPEFTIVIRDVTERKRFEDVLLHRIEFEAFLFELSSTFISLPEEDIDANMQHGLARVGQFLNMDRVTLLELFRDREEMTVAYSWSTTGVVNPAKVLEVIS